MLLQPRTLEYFEKPARGSYNRCYFVKFDSEKWVIRVPLAPCLAFGGKNKLENEIATMHLVAEKTTSPIPKMYASQKTKDHGWKSSKKLADEPSRRQVIGYEKPLSQLRKFSIHSLQSSLQSSLQLGRQCIINDDDHTNHDDHDPLLTSANNYVAMLLDIADNAFAEGRSSVFEDEVGAALYHLHIFHQYAAEKWLDHRLDQGPFFLVHDMEVVSLLDWEWSRVVPRQFFNHPLWLGKPDTTKLAYNFAYQDYLELFDQFQAIVRTRQRERYGNELLPDEWVEAKVDSGFLVANALKNQLIWTGINLGERVKAFMDDDPVRKDLIARKLREGNSYKAEVDRLKDTNLSRKVEISTT
ncbi:hypothetical protein QBC33DRAFT_593905 [Phialemonium atrogriseum]|uniref:Aminoglycoside phosphotransferase domain-containing protein n=1 Tax=Phialemonium atrogriseum TaxID=1093897 RepID=A0AAJ0FK04_9PEZI|nr:uncharacterized protein QBC33DRAFT_593905 [Phialemonium atrogriseum]KAK1765029.1 hypothetical protein QBC33DRAFT_593905 [Phialemonium atrogriseum]